MALSRLENQPLAATFLAGLVLALLVYAELLAPNALATDQDAFHYFLAQRVRLAQTIGTAAVFWEPAVDCGRPFFADPTVLAAYPGNAILFLIEPIPATKLLLLLHVALAAVCGACYARSFELPPLSAGLAGLLYAASGPVLSHAWSPMWLYGLAWLPLAMALTRGILVRGELRCGLYLGLVVALMILAGAYELLLAFGVYAALESVLALVRDRRAALRGLGVLSGAALLSLLLAAVQLIPTAELFALGSRSGGIELEDSGLWSLPWARLPEALIPGLFGSPGGRDLDLALVAAHPVERSPFLGGIYLGLGAALLAVTGARRAPRPARWLLLSLMVVPALLALGRGTPLFALARAALPGFALFRYPEKIFSLVALPLAVLAAFGFEGLRGEEDRDRRRSLALTLGALGLFILALSVTFLARGPVLREIGRSLMAAGSRQSAPAVLGKASAALAWSGVVAGLMVAALALLRRTRHRLLLLGFVTLLVLDPALVSRGLQRRGPRDGLLRRPPTLPDPEELASALGAERIATLRPARGVRIVPQHASMLGFLSADAYGSIRLASRRRFDAGFQGSEQRRFELQSVGLVLAPLPGREALYHPMMLEARRIPAPPRLALIGRSRLVPDSAAGAVLGSADFRPGEELILAEGPTITSAAPLEGRVELVESSAARLAIDVEASRPCYLRIADSFYPGWEARIDGESAPVLRADLCFRAVAVPAGRHRVVMAYRPRGFGLGLALSLLGLGASLALELWFRKRAAAIIA